MKTRSVETILPPQAPHRVGDGFRVHNFFPSGHRIGHQRMSPFFLMDYGAKTPMPPTERPRGVGPHPHRGFETVTLAFEGKVAHHDSAGNRGVIGEGDVQWMTAGSGILHKEYHEAEWARKGGTLHMVQLWVNLPARHKMAPPAYQGITREAMGRHDLPSGLGHVEVVAGRVGTAQGPARTFTPIHLSKAFLKAGAEVTYTLPEAWNAGLLVLEGAVSVEGSQARADHFVLFRNDGDTVTVRALDPDKGAVVLVLAGEPIGEPVAAYGPFVMNTQEEIHQAVEDFQAGKFGRLD